MLRAGEAELRPKGPAGVEVLDGGGSRGRGLGAGLLDPPSCRDEPIATLLASLLELSASDLEADVLTFSQRSDLAS